MPQDEIVDLVPIETREISINRTPDVVLGEAKRAATALTAILAKKPKPVMIRGKQFLEFEDWSVLAKFYGVVAKVIDSKYVEYGTSKGFESIAVAFHIHSGQEISRGYGMCTSDEKIDDSTTRADWSLQRLRSFSQTRACSKALKQVFSWVAVLGGYASLPAEEIQHEASSTQNNEVPIKSIAVEIQDLIGVMCGGDQVKMDAMIKDITAWKDKEKKDVDGNPLINALTFADINRLTSNPSKHAWIRKIHSRVSALAQENRK